MSNTMARRNQYHEQDLELELSSPGLTSSDSQQDIEEPSLGDEVEAHFKKITLREEDIDIRHEIRIAVEKAVNAAWSGATVNFYGSFSYGMSGRHSPLDLVIEGCNDMDNTFTRIISLLSAIIVPKRIMQNPTEAIIRATARDSQIPVNLLFLQSISGSDAELSSKKVKEWIRRYPCLPSVVCSIRSLLINEDIHFLTTYQLVLMFVSMCVHYEGYVNDAGLMVVDFLDYFGQIFNFSDAITPASSQPLLDADCHTPVVIIDPITGINISSNLTQLEKVRICSAFRRGLNNLNDWVCRNTISSGPLQALMGGSYPEF
eukprot:TRINITY_DN30456_c0_g1_i1.p1 TRINITY_DN30456_c0_g1~~TRINITY_DN30456_c0_g1_i1.p1  ORF type:complete len:317 (+),score=38.85 TRINITY_DN30456_c0_g1_i1:73-1023(+)